MSATEETRTGESVACANCGALGADLHPCPCRDPRCAIGLICPRCVRTVKRNVAKQAQANLAASKATAEAVFANPDLRAQMEAAIERTRTTEPVPDDPEWMRRGATPPGRTRVWQMHPPEPTWLHLERHRIAQEFWSVGHDTSFLSAPASMKAEYFKLADLAIRRVCRRAGEPLALRREPVGASAPYIFGEVPPGLTAEKLGAIADWLDTFDRMADLWLRGWWPVDVGDYEVNRVREALVATRNREAQTVLRGWASRLDERGVAS